MVGLKRDNKILLNSFIYEVSTFQKILIIEKFRTAVEILLVPLK